MCRIYIKTQNVIPFLSALMWEPEIFRQVGKKVVSLMCQENLNCWVREKYF